MWRLTVEKNVMFDYRRMWRLTVQKNVTFDCTEECDVWLYRRMWRFDCTEECDVLTVDDWFCIIRPLKKWMLARLWFGKYFVDN